MTTKLTLDDMNINREEFQLLTEIISAHNYSNFPLKFLLTRYLKWDDDTVENFTVLFETEKSKNTVKPNSCKYGCDN
jgi:hypothetical protein